jgi:hypothetical protein
MFNKQYCYYKNLWFNTFITISLYVYYFILVLQKYTLLIFQNTINFLYLVENKINYDIINMS